MSVKLSFEDGSKLKGIFGAISIVNEEVDFKLDDKGLTVRQMDKERVAMVDLFMKKEMFSEYDMAEQASEVFTVDIENFQKIKLKAAPVTLTFNIRTSKCQMQQDKPFGRTFSIPFQASELVDVPRVKGEFDTTAKITVETLRELVEDAELCSDYLVVDASKDKIAFRAKGDLQTWASEIPVGNEALLEYSSSKPSKAYFSLGYIKEIAKELSSLSETVQLKLKTDFPMLMNLEPKELKDLQLSYVLAPRIEHE